MAKSKSLERYRLKKTLDVLSQKKGFHTELISVYIPPDKKLTDVINNLKNEAGTATNIKSRLTKKNVTNALAIAQQRLRMVKTIPENGLVLFVGAIPETGPGTEKMEVHLFEPPDYLNVYRYLCSSEFWLDPLQDMLIEKEAFGLMAISRNEAAIVTIRGNHLNIVISITSGIPGKHRAGGQSARRFERVIEQLTHEFMIRIGENANEVFLGMEGLRGLLVGGSGFTKEQFLDGKYLDQRLKPKVIAIIDLGYGGTEGIRELLDRGREHLENVRYLDEKAIMQRFLGELSKDSGLVTYGEKEVRKALIAGAVDILIISEAVDLTRVLIVCSNCDQKESLTKNPLDLQKLKQNIANEKCPNCNNANTWGINEKVSIVDDLTELAQATNATVEMLSTETEEGTQLYQGFGGIAAILRFRFT